MRKINIVLYEPEIAANTAAIMRTVAAIDATLHIIEPTGFIIDQRTFGRSSAGNWQNANYVMYDDWSDFITKHKDIKLYCLTRYGKRPLSDFNFSKVDEEVYLMFGKESTGIPKSILQQNKELCFRIPMVSEARSLNIANTVGIAAYEVLRQWDYLNLSKLEVQKGADYLDD